MARKKAFDEMFLNATVMTAADVGIEFLRTKQVAELAGFSEATLFRAFETKEDLLCSTFLWIDRELMQILNMIGEARGEDGCVPPNALQTVWERLCGHLFSRRERAKYWIRFRYSSLYTDEIKEKREQCNSDVREALSKTFGGLTAEQTEMLLQYVLEMTVFLAEKSDCEQVSELQQTQSCIWAAASAAAKEMRPA